MVGYINAHDRGLSQNRRRGSYPVSAVAVPERNLFMIRSVLLARVLEYYGFTAKAKTEVPEIVWRGNEDCVAGICGGCFNPMGP